jgi:riboflavin biosynthesis pyrimidine reductase
VGSRTVEFDDPQLNVRHVRGPDPTRVVVSASGRLLHDGKRRRIFDGAGATVVTTDAAARLLPASLPPGARIVALGGGAHAELEVGRICEALRAHGITSLFVEGGARTLSSFLRQGAIDLLQIHIAPRILGSGLGAFALPEVDSMDESRRFSIESFTLDGELLVECRARTG